MMVKEKEKLGESYTWIPEGSINPTLESSDVLPPRHNAEHSQSNHIFCPRGTIRVNANQT